MEHRFQLRPPRLKSDEAAEAMRRPGARCTLVGLKVRGLVLRELGPPSTSAPCRSAPNPGQHS